MKGREARYGNPAVSVLYRQKRPIGERGEYHEEVFTANPSDERADKGIYVQGNNAFSERIEKIHAARSGGGDDVDGDVYIGGKR